MTLAEEAHAQREQRLEALRAKLKARKGRPGLEENVNAIEEEIARLEAEG